MRGWIAGLAVAAALLPRVAPAFVAFEAGQVRPLALSPDRQTLFAVNTPDARLEIFTVGASGLEHRASVPVGLEPVAVAARTNTEVWVVNHLSDSISIVDAGADPPRVVRTLLVGDEPRDIVFAGPTDSEGFFTRAFITTARLGQNLPPSIPIAATTPGTPRALVWVFDATAPDTSLGGTPLTVLELFGDTPRALAASPDGSTVYAAIFQSGNGTATVPEGAVCDGGAAAPPCALDGVQVPGGLPDAQMPGGLPPPNANHAGDPAPEVGLIVRFNPDTGIFEDELGRNWNNAIRFRLPDRDVFRIDALATPPREVAAIARVGTVLFNMAVHPTTGMLFVTNTEARNEVRFEGRGEGTTTVRGRLHEARITIVDGEQVLPRHLNPHLTALPDGYRTRPMPAEAKAASLAQPLDLVIASDGTVYVAGFGSQAVGVFDSAALVEGTFTPDATTQIPLAGGGPTGLALDEARQRLYVLTRFDNAISVIDTTTRETLSRMALFNPEPPVVSAGRPLLYDARATSSNGEASCAVCHIFADVDSLAWDLGNPEEDVHPSFNPLGPTGLRLPFHPMKGPMTTQTLRGMANQGPMHWRGDRTGAQFIGDRAAYDTTLAFTAFQVAFDALLGRDEGELSDADMQAFTEFILRVQPPPNPIRALDNQLTPAQARGRALFLNRDALTDPAAHCAGCHTLDPANGNFGTLGQTTFDEESQEFKVPQLKNMYQKIGMFGTPHDHFVATLPAHAAFQGDQIRGFGFLHDGSVATIFDFLRTRTFTQPATPHPLTDEQRADLEQYMFVFDTTFAPIVGQQVTLTAANAAAVGPRIDLLLQRAATPFAIIGQPTARECDLVARAVLDGELRGFLYDPVAGTFRSDRLAEPALDDAALRARAVAGAAITYTCVPPGEGHRLALDRDGDTLFDRDELDAGSDPADPSDPLGATPTPTVTPTVTPTATRTPTPRVRALGDVNCDDLVDDADVRTMCNGLFDRRLRTRCDMDCNEDGAFTAADVTCVAAAVAAAR